MIRAFEHPSGDESSGGAWALEGLIVGAVGLVDHEALFAGHLCHRVMAQHQFAIECPGDVRLLIASNVTVSQGVADFVGADVGKHTHPFIKRVDVRELS